MASLSQSESGRLYSWWWDSHIPKNSKWIQDNLADMDSKVKTMIKLIEADADSFARRADMYFKKRPELMKLVEELYRAYRALAERYDHTTVELRRAHKVMVEAFPNQMSFDMIEDSASSSSEPRTEADTEALQKDGTKSKRSFSQMNKLDGTSDSHEADSEVETLKRTLLELQTEKEALNLQYQLILSKVSRFEKELNDAQKDVKGFDERACKADIEIKILKESLAKLEVERDTGLLQYSQAIERIADLEASISHGQEYAKGLTNRVSEAEREAMSLKKELSRLQSEKEAGLLRYNKSLELISSLEKTIRDAEESVRVFRDQSEQAETEIKALKQELLKLNEVNEDLNVRYQQCLETISKLEREVSHAQDNAKRLSSEVLAGAAKIKTVEEQCALLESFNQTMKVEAENLAHKMSAKDQELSQKQNEIEKLQAVMQEEQLRFSELGASLRNLESLHSQSQEEQKVLTSELHSRIQMLRELEMRNSKLEGDISSKEENRNLSEINDTSISLEIQKNEISCLKKMKEKLEEEVAKQMNQSSALQVEIHCVKGNIDSMNRRYQKLIDQVSLTGFDPESLSYSVKKLQDENSKLVELCTNQRDENNAVTGKLCEMDSILKRNADLEKLLLESNTKLDGSREKAKDLIERCESLRGEKSELAAERANLVSQLQIMTANMQTLLEKNSVLEKSLSCANIELESLRDKSKCFDDFFQFLKNDKSELMKERESLVSQLCKVEEKLGVLEKKYTELEVRYTDLQRDNKLKSHQVEELQVSLAAEKQESANYKRSTESRLADLQKNVSFLREECRSRKREYEDELDRVVNKQVEIFILQKLIEDLEQKNFSLLIECQKHVEASEFSEKLIAELESENLEQQMEAEIFLDEIDSLRGAIYQVIKALQVEADCKTEQKITKDQISVSRALGEIDSLKGSLSSAEYEMHRLVVENSVLLSLLGQFQSDGLVLESEKNILEKDLKTKIHQCGMLEKDKQDLQEANRLLKSKLIKREQQEQKLRAELKFENLKFESLHDSYMVLQQDYSYTLNDNKTLLLKFSEFKDGMHVVEEENDAILQEAVALSNTCVVYRSFGSEMAEEVEDFVETVSSLREISTGLKRKVETLEKKLEGKEKESQGLNKMLENLQEGLEEDNFLTGLLEHQVSNVDEILEHREMEILEAEHMLKATNNENEELHKEVEELRKDYEDSRRMRANLEWQISELSDVAGRQEEEIRKLNALNENLESEVQFLNKEIQRQQVREEYLSLELQEKSNEIGLWDSADPSSSLSPGEFRFIDLSNEICAKMTQDVEMKDNNTPSQSIISSSTSTMQNLKEIAALIDTGSYTKEVRRIARAVRLTIGLRQKLTGSVLSSFLDFALVPGSEAHSRLSSFVPKGDEHDMEVDTASSATQAAPSKHLPAELEIYCYFIVLLFLIDQKKYNEAKACSSASIARLKNVNRRTIDVIASRLYFYYSLSYEQTGDLAEIRGTLLALHHSATLRHDELGQETLLNLLLRNYLHYNLYDQAEKLRSKAPRFEAHSNQQFCRYLFYLGKIRTIQLEYTDAKESLLQAARKAPIAALGFRIQCNKWAILVRLLLGEIPERSIFTQKGMEKALRPYFELTNAVRIGDLELFRTVQEKFLDTFAQDRTHNLIVRLRHNVIRTGLRNISISYSRISLPDVAKKLRLNSENPVADAESIVAKAIRDGAIDATIDHKNGCMVSKETGDIYSTNEPQTAFNSRIAFCLNMHNEAVRALRFPPNTHKEKESDEKRRERKQQEEELAKHMAEEDDDDF